MKGEYLKRILVTRGKNDCTLIINGKAINWTLLIEQANKRIKIYLKSSINPSLNRYV